MLSNRTERDLCVQASDQAAIPHPCPRRNDPRNWKEHGLSAETARLPAARVATAAAGRFAERQGRRWLLTLVL